jgi:hypothetical protein
MSDQDKISRPTHGTVDHAPEDLSRTERIEREKASKTSTWKRDNLALQTEDPERTKEIEEAKKRSGGPL